MSGLSERHLMFSSIFWIDVFESSFVLGIYHKTLKRKVQFMMLGCHLNKCSLKISSEITLLFDNFNNASDKSAIINFVYIFFY